MKTILPLVLLLTAATAQAATRDEADRRIRKGHEDYYRTKCHGDEAIADIVELHYMIAALREWRLSNWVNGYEIDLDLLTAEQLVAEAADLYALGCRALVNAMTEKNLAVLAMIDPADADQAVLKMDGCDAWLLVANTAFDLAQNRCDEARAVLRPWMAQMAGSGGGVGTGGNGGGPGAIP